MSRWQQVSGALAKGREAQDPYLIWFKQNEALIEAEGWLRQLVNPTGAKTERVAYALPFVIERCTETGFMFANPRLHPDAAVNFFNTPGMASYFNTVEASIKFRRDNSYIPVARMLREKLPEAKTLLEIGCGGGGFLEVLRDYGFKVEGNEIAEGARPHWEKRGLVVHTPPLEMLELKSRYDVVLMWSVMDHFCDPVAALKKCHSLLNPGGHIFIGNVNTDGFDHQTLGFDSVTYRPPGRVNYYNLRSLAKHLEIAGFKVVSQSTPGELDVEMVRDYLGSAVSDNFATALQSFLKRSNMSGYQQVLAVRE